jgi:hypothetical protein
MYASPSSEPTLEEHGRRVHLALDRPLAETLTLGERQEV